MTSLSSLQPTANYVRSIPFALPSTEQTTPDHQVFERVRGVRALQAFHAGGAGGVVGATSRVLRNRGQGQATAAAVRLEFRARPELISTGLAWLALRVGARLCAGGWLGYAFNDFRQTWHQELGHLAHERHAIGRPSIVFRKGLCRDLKVLYFSALYNRSGVQVARRATRSVAS